MLVFGLSSAASANEGGGHGEGGGAGGVIKMDMLVVNLDAGRYVGFTPLVKLADPVDEAVVKGFTPVLRHEMIKLLLGKAAATVQTAEFIGGYSHQLTESFNKLLNGDYVKDVFFDNWIVQ
jgi:flagellar basal body-associated protein FliL